MLIGQLIQNPMIATKTAIQTVNNTEVLVDATDLNVTLEPNTRYGFMLCVILNSSAIAGMDVAFTAPTGATGGYEVPSGAGATLNAFTAEKAFNGGGGTDVLGLLFGFILTGDTVDADFQVQFAQETAEVSNSSILEGSYLLCWKQTE